MSTSTSTSTSAAMADVSAPKGKVVRSEKLRAVLDMQCKSGHTALHLAAQNGNSEAVNILLYYNADPEVKSSEGDTPLMSAVSQNHLAAAELLLKYKASAIVRGKDKKSALQRAMKSRGHDMFKAIINSGVALNTNDFAEAISNVPEDEKKTFKTTWEESLASRVKGVASVLAREGVNLPYSDSGSSALHIVAEYVGMDVQLDMPDPEVPRVVKLFGKENIGLPKGAST